MAPDGLDASSPTITLRRISDEGHHIRLPRTTATAFATFAFTALLAGCGGDEASYDIDPRELTAACEGIDASGVEATFLAVTVGGARPDTGVESDRYVAVFERATSEECPEHAEAWTAYDPPDLSDEDFPGS